MEKVLVMKVKRSRMVGEEGAELISISYGSKLTEHQRLYFFKQIFLL